MKSALSRLIGNSIAMWFNSVMREWWRNRKAYLAVPDAEQEVREAEHEADEVEWDEFITKLEREDALAIPPSVILHAIHQSSGALFFVGDAEGQAHLIVARLGHHALVRALTSAVMAGIRQMRVIHTDSLSDFEVPLPPDADLSTELTTLASRSLSVATERIRLAQWCFDTHDPALTIWAGYGPQSRTWVVWEDEHERSAEDL